MNAGCCCLASSTLQSRMPARERSCLHFDSSPTSVNVIKIVPETCAQRQGPTSHVILGSVKLASLNPGSMRCYLTVNKYCLYIASCSGSGEGGSSVDASSVFEDKEAKLTWDSMPDLERWRQYADKLFYYFYMYGCFS